MRIYKFLERNSGWIKVSIIALGLLVWGLVYCGVVKQKFWFGQDETAIPDYHAARRAAADIYLNVGNESHRLFDIAEKNGYRCADNKEADSVLYYKGRMQAFLDMGDYVQIKLMPIRNTLKAALDSVMNKKQ